MTNNKPKKLEPNETQEGIILKDIQRFGDDRGDFTNIELNEFGNFKRTYIIKNTQKNVIRAFHGHNKESKLFYVPKGAFKFIIMNMETLEWKEYTLLESVPKVLFIPKGYYNGFVSLTDDSILIVFSSSTIEESKKDDIRLPYDFLGKEVWQINHR
ncbi:MAG: WxcM-like domain-containing protein [Candidatus Woesearchaeota archaeon]